MSRVAIYMRSATTHQGWNPAIDKQRKACLKYCTQEGWTIVEEFFDEGFFSQEDARPGFNRLIAAARQTPAPFDMIITDDRQRISRDDAYAHAIRREMQQLGIPFISAASPDPDRHLNRQLVDTPAT